MTDKHTKKPHYIHRMSYSAQEKLVGVFVIAALAILFSLFTINASNLHLFEDYIHVELHVKNAEDIALDTPVRISGIQVGRVDRIEITPKHMVSIRVKVFSSYASMLRTDSKPNIRLSLLGRSSIEFTAGNPDYPELESGTVLIVDEPLSIDDLMAQLTPVLANIEQSIADFSAIVAAINPSEISQLVTNVNGITHDLHNLTSAINNGEGTLGMLIHDQAFALNMHQTLTNLESAIATAELRMQDLGPVITGLQPTVTELGNAAPHISELFHETVIMLSKVNSTLTSLEPDVQQLPELMTRVNILTEQANRLLNRMSQSWILSSGKNTAEQQVELVPHD